MKTIKSLAAAALLTIACAAPVSAEPQCRVQAIQRTDYSRHGHWAGSITESRCLEYAAPAVPAMPPPSLSDKVVVPKAEAGR